MTGYTITNWGHLYENSETKKLKSLKWVALPNKHDGLGFRLMVREKDGPQLFAAWVCIVQIASRAELKDERGTLVRGGRPMTADDLEAMTGFDSALFDRAFSFFSSPRVNWITKVPCADFPEILRESPEILRESPEILRESPEVPGSFPAKPGSFPVEGKGREGNEGREEGASAPAAEPGEEIYLTFPTKSEDWHLREKLALQLEADHPAVNVELECKKALAWVKASPRNRKTEAGMEKFLRNWLGKAVSQAPPSRPETFFDEYNESYINGQN
jgi:hypothetical protein